MPAFDLQKCLEIISKYKINRAALVPPIITALAKHPLVDKYDLTSMECILSGAAPLGGEVQIACGKRLNCLVKQVA
jgi:non-ribosomal peptide synthetase component E (peptide arylation enzyme)